MIQGDTVVARLRLDQPREVVFDFFVEPTKLVQWLGISADLDARPGGRFRFEVAPGQYCEGRYVEIVPPARVVFTWGWADPVMGVPPGSSRVEVDLVADGPRTVLTLVHRGLPADDARLLHDDGWTRFLARLAAVSAGGEAPAYPTGGPAARLEELRATKPSGGSGSGG